MIYQLRITMQDVEPPIWRRVLVDGESSLGDLHLIFQIAMGWTNSHLHEFRIGNSRYGTCDPALDDFDEDVQDEDLITLEQAAPFVGVEFLYEYDFGDSWVHLVKVEAITEPESKAFKPACLAGERSCPPENVGGITGYAEFLEALADGDHPEYSSIIEWIGGEFDPEHYPIALVNEILSRFELDALFDTMEEVSYTYRQGQYLSYIHYYTKVNGIPPAHADIQRYFGVTPPTVNSMLKRLDEAGLIARIPRQARSIRVLLHPEDIPELD